MMTVCHLPTSDRTSNFGLSHGLFATSPHIINADLLAFIEDRTTS
ncbi:hypothetical protein [Bradyrhizobium yuanmingense]|nr:hypothetical protein [Bradyrhizobium yuanmingense]MDF0518594.1 hypothetical protein [Bradyrhizobium yuanmingense]MDF0579731.1 hypothetical protein [Bradyrhizobium yuanmingense]